MTSRSTDVFTAFDSWWSDPCNGNTPGLRISLFCLVGVCATLVVGLAAIHYALASWRSDVVQTWSRIKLGDPEARVLSLLGKPFRVFDKATAPSNYYVSGYQFKRRSISGKVLIYSRKDLVYYIWIGPTSVVEDLFIGGS